VRFYEQTKNCSLADEVDAGRDLLADRLDLIRIRQEQLLLLANTDVNYLFGNLVNFRYVPLQSVILHHIRLSENLFFSG